LLDFKAAVDRQGLLPWTEKGGANAGYCTFVGVSCDAQGNVEKLSLLGAGLGGTLPPAAVLQGLTALRAIGLGSVDITGTLPASWGALTQLEDLRIGNNPGITGRIPESWAGLTRLKVLILL
jgi:hypothetical protein